jgi:hypothetical protein
MALIEGLLALLVLCIVAGVIRKLRGGSFLPPPHSDGDYHVQDASGRCWRYNVEDPDTIEQTGRKKAAKDG